MDPNAYAYSIELSLNTSTAKQQLDMFLEDISNIENRIIDMSSRASESISNILVGANTGIRELQNALQSFDVQPPESNAEQQVNDNLEQQLDIRENILDVIEKIRTIDDKNQITYVKEEKQLKGFLGFFEKIAGAITKKNTLHDDELNYVTEEGRSLSKMPSTVDNITRSLSNSNNQHGRSINYLREIYNLIIRIDEECENFVTTNYRIYGTQQQIAQQTRLIAAEYGLLRQSTFDAMEILGNMNVPIDQIERYAVSIAKATRHTGVAIPLLATYANRMRQVDINAAAIERQLEFTSEAMRKFGLDTSDLNSILSDTARSTMELELIFKGDMQIQKYDQLRMVIAGLGKQFGMTADDTNMLFTTLEDPSKRMLFEQFAGQSINSVEDLATALDKSGKRAAEYIQQLEQQGLSAIELQIHLDAVSESYGFGSSKAMLMAAKLSESANKMGLNIGNAKELDKILQQAQRDGIDPFSEANSTLTMQLNLLQDRTVALISYALQPMSDVLLYGLQVINSLADSVIEIVKKLDGFIDTVQDLIPGVDVLFSAFKYGAGTALLLTGMIVGTAAAFGLLRGTMVYLEDAIVRMFTGLGRGLVALGTMVSGVVLQLMGLGAAFVMVGAGSYMLAQSVSIIAEKGWAGAGALAALTAAILLIGGGLVAAGTAATAALPGILALSVGFLAIGGSAMMFGKGLTYAAEALEITSNAVKTLSSGVLSNFAAELVATSLTIPVAAYNLNQSSQDLQEALDTIVSTVMSIGDISNTVQQFEQLVQVMTDFSQSINTILVGVRNMGINIQQTIDSISTSIASFSNIDVNAFGVTVDKLKDIGWTLFYASLSFRLASKFGPTINNLAGGLSALVDSANQLKEIDTRLFMANITAITPIGLKLSEVAVGFNEGAQKIGVAALAFGSGIAALADGADKLSDINMIDFYNSVSVLEPMGKILSRSSVDFLDGATAVGEAAQTFGDGIVSLANGAKALEDVDMFKFMSKVSMLKPIGSHLQMAAVSFYDGVYGISEPAAELVTTMDNISKSFKSIEDIKFFTITSELLKGSEQLNSVVEPLSSAIKDLLPLSEQLQSFADDMKSATTHLSTAANNIVTAANSMSTAIQPLYQFFDTISYMSVVMNDVGQSLLLSTNNIRLSGTNLVIAAQSFVTAGNIILQNVDLFVQSSTVLDFVSQNISNSIDNILESTVALSDINFDVSKFSAAAAAFKDPADALSNSFVSISNAFAGLDAVGVNISDRIDALAFSIESSAIRMVAIANVVNSAIISASSTLQSTIDNAEDIIRAQPIPTVIVMNKTEGLNNTDRSTALLEQQNQFLSKLVDAVGSMSNKDISKIVNDAADKLLAYSGGDSGSGFMMNQWARG